MGKSFGCYNSTFVAIKAEQDLEDVITVVKKSLAELPSRSTFAMASEIFAFVDESFLRLPRNHEDL
jgi:hypothetical protein